MTQLDQMLCGDLRTHVEEILEDWQEATQEEPWLSLPREHRIDHLPAVVRGLIDVALCGPSSEAAHRAMVEASAKRGSDRRDQGTQQELVFTEHYLLRKAMQRYLERVAGPERASDALIRIDMAISLATRASLQGYHRRELERMDRWPAVLDLIVSESPLLAED
ncbi:MAG: hypothetical protein ACRENI_00610 [Gemmatimonadaceae bacterium]